MGTRATPEASRQNGGHSRSDDQVRPAGVAVCTPNLIAIGYIYRPHDQRLLDVLNKGLDRSPVADSPQSRMVNAKDFVFLRDVKVSFPKGGQKHLASTHIRKANILFVAEISGGQPETGAAELMKVTKKSVGTEVHVPPYDLVGQMHAEIWEQLADHLEGHNRFLPLTNVSITPELLNIESRFDFVAVNKDQIVYVREFTDLIPQSAPAETERRKKRKPETTNGECLECGYPVVQSLRWRTYSRSGALLCRACKSPLS